VGVLFRTFYRSQGIDEEEPFLFHLDHRGRRRDAFKCPVAAVAVYDLSKLVRRYDEYARDRSWRD
jgi:hypothetical protein